MTSNAGIHSLHLVRSITSKRWRDRARSLIHKPTNTLKKINHLYTSYKEPYIRTTNRSEPVHPTDRNGTNLNPSQIYGFYSETMFTNYSWSNTTLYLTSTKRPKILMETQNLSRARPSSEHFYFLMRALISQQICCRQYKIKNAFFCSGKKLEAGRSQRRSEPWSSTTVSGCTRVFTAAVSSVRSGRWFLCI